MHFSHLTGVLVRKVENELAASALVITAAKLQNGFVFVSFFFFFFSFLFFHFFNIWVGSWVRGPLHTTMDYHVPLTFKCSEQLHPNVSVHGVQKGLYLDVLGSIRSGNYGGVQSNVDTPRYYIHIYVLLFPSFILQSLCLIK